LEIGRLDFILGRSRWALNSAVVILLLSFVIVMEAVFPWTMNLSQFVKEEHLTWSHSLPPSVAGVVVGALQFPLVWLLTQHIGGSSFYVTVAANLLFSVKGSRIFNTLRNCYWQVFLAVGLIMGSFGSIHLSGANYLGDDLTSPTHAIVGGFLMVFGARMAGGPLSAHGFSGISALVVNSYFMVPFFVFGFLFCRLIIHNPI